MHLALVQHGVLFVAVAVRRKPAARAPSARHPRRAPPPQGRARSNTLSSLAPRPDENAIVEAKEEEEEEEDGDDDGDKCKGEGGEDKVSDMLDVGQGARGTILFKKHARAVLFAGRIGKRTDLTPTAQTEGAVGALGVTRGASRGKARCRCLAVAVEVGCQFLWEESKSKARLRIARVK